MQDWRSLLFVPADREDRLRAAFASAAHAVVCDLEDAVPTGRKRSARRLVRRLLPQLEGRPARLVRVNSSGGVPEPEDLEALAGLDLDALVVPKASAAGIAGMGRDGPPIVAVVETARGLREAYEIALLERVSALALGAVDLSLELGLEPRADSLELLHARSRLVLDSRAAGVRAPFDRVYPLPGDALGLEADARLARSLGFRGKSCTAIDDAAVVNRVFAATPTDAGAKERLYAD